MMQNIYTVYSLNIHTQMLVIGVMSISAITGATMKNK